jgi:hypothetical protein
MNLGLIAKALTAGLGAASTAGTVALQDGHIQFWEWFTIVGSALLAFVVVYFVNNTEALRFGKAVASLLVSLGAFVGTALLDGHLSNQEWIGLVMAGFTAFATWYTPNSTSSDEFKV